MPIEFENSPEYDLHSSIHAAPIVDQYQTEKQILSSDLSSVYIVRNRFTGELYTLKAIRKTAGISFDFNRIIKLKHENIVTMSAHYETEKFHYIIKPFVEGIDLQKYVNTYGPLNRVHTSQLIKQLISAIKYLHDRKEPLIFRDLKPSNIIVEPASNEEDFKITLVDIETMRQKSVAKRSDTYYVMSHGYTSPEQYGYRQTDVRSDLYSLGATLYFAITGVDPGNEKLIAKSCLEKSTLTDKRLALAIERCLAFDPDNRFADIFAFERALKRIDYAPLIRKNGIAIAAVLFLTLGISFAFSFEVLREFAWFPTMNSSTTQLTTETQLSSVSPVVFDLPTPLELIASNVSTAEIGSTEIDPAEIDPTENDPTEIDPVGPQLRVANNQIEQSLGIGTSSSSSTSTSSNTSTSTDLSSESGSGGEAPTVSTPLQSATNSVESVVQTTQPSTQPMTQPMTQPFTESTTESSQLTSPLYYRGELLVASQNGITITTTRDTHYKIWADRSKLTESQKEFEFMSVFSYGDLHGNPDFGLWSTNAVEKGHGFHIYYDAYGYGSSNTLQHYVVFLFDSNKNLVGTIDFKNIR